MPDLDLVREAPEKLIFDVLDDTRAGMLSVVGSGQHPQPMTHHLDRAAADLWFIASRSSDLFEAIDVTSRARFIVISEPQDVHISVVGALQHVDDPDKLDALWSPVASALFEHGRSDPDVVLLRMRLIEAALWASQDNALKIGLNVLRSSLGGSAADLGYHTVVDLAA